MSSHERHNPIVTEHTVGAADSTVYSAPSSPRGIAVSVFNGGDKQIDIRFQGTTVYLPLPPGSGIRANPDVNIYARCESGTSTALVATGVEQFRSGASTTGGLSTVEIATLAASRTQKELLAEILLQLRLSNRYRSEWHGEEYTERDLL